MKIESPTRKQRMEIAGAAAGLTTGVVLYKTAQFAKGKGFGINKPFVKMVRKYNFPIEEQDAVKTLKLLKLNDSVEIINSKQYKIEEIEQLLKQFNEKLAKGNISSGEKKLIQFKIRVCEKAKKTADIYAICRIVLEVLKKTYFQNKGLYV